MKAVVAEAVGGPENLKYIDVPAPQPAPGEVLVKLAAIGVNMIDTYYRKGIYKAPETPILLGSEGAGTIAAVGSGVNFKPGQRVAYSMARGAYAEYAIVPQQLVVELPAAVSFEDGAAALLQGMTAHYLTHSTFALKPGHVCLIHAAAGGTGLLIVQMAKIAGAVVIGTCSTPEKAKLVAENGADHVIRYGEQNFVAEVKKITGNAGVDVVYDSVGKSTFADSLDCLKPRGLMVSFGQSSGPIGEINPLLLQQKGSLYLTRPNLANYISDPAEMQWRSSDLFGWLADGRLNVRIYKQYKLADAASAHRDLESRRTTGKLLLIP
ncbi:MAG TPA: quinone oxidoreductase [Bryobacteraceae bacterium]|jgi:NADPH2:quinone reductase|nr:quinone oxidoreductase [Bryobacteraceae bacterium]